MGGFRRASGRPDRGAAFPCLCPDGPRPSPHRRDVHTVIPRDGRAVHLAMMLPALSTLASAASGDPDTTTSVAPDPVQWGMLLLMVLALIAVAFVTFMLALFAVRRGRAARSEAPRKRAATPDPWAEAGQRADPIDDDAEFEEDDEDEDDEDDIWEDEPEGPEDDDDDGDVHTRRPPSGTPPPPSAAPPTPAG